MISVMFLVACEQAQEGVPKDVSYVSMDKIKVDTSEQNSISEVTKESTTSDAVDEETTEDETEATSEEEETAEEESGEEDSSTLSTENKEIVIIAKETDLIKLQAVAYDPDKEQLKYTYSSPMSQDGQWQTTYGDAGEYTVTITASDGELTSSKDALLIVNRKEESPTIDEFTPHEIAANIDENTKIEFSIKSSDLNKDKLEFTWKLDGEDVSSTEEFDYYADYGSAGSHTVKVDVTDGKTVTSMIWSINVRNVDRAPVLKIIPDITVKETETVRISPEAADPDNDTIKYIISEPVGDSGVWETTYDSAGVYEVKVTATDGELEDIQTVKVTVINVNRAPVIDNIVKVE
jgi:hypothetical protein